MGADNTYSLLQFAYHTRTGCSDDFPDAVTVMGSNDKNRYTDIYTVNSGLPQAVNKTYTSDIFNCSKVYRYLRFKVIAERTYWHMGEFELHAISSKATVKGEYNSIKAEDIEALYDLLAVAKSVYDNSTDENELAEMYKRLSERYNAILKSSGIKKSAISAKSDTVYDLSGRQQKKEPQNGIYIINGKKRMIK